MSPGGNDRAIATAMYICRPQVLPLVSKVSLDHSFTWEDVAQILVLTMCKCIVDFRLEAAELVWD